MFSGYPRVELDVSAVETAYEVKKGTLWAHAHLNIVLKT